MSLCKVVESVTKGPNTRRSYQSSIKGRLKFEQKGKKKFRKRYHDQITQIAIGTVKEVVEKFIKELGFTISYADLKIVTHTLSASEVK